MVVACLRNIGQDSEPGPFECKVGVISTITTHILLYRF